MRSLFTMIILLNVAAAAAQHDEEQKVTIEKDGDRIEAIQNTIELSKEEVETKWNSFLQARHDMATDVNDVKAEESLRANNSTTGTVGDGIMDMELIIEAENENTSTVFLIAKDESTPYYPKRISEETKLVMMDVIQDFERYAETGFMQEDETY